MPNNKKPNNSNSVTYLSSGPRPKLDRGFNLPWDTDLPVAVFKTKQQKPYDISERLRLSEIMTVKEILDTSLIKQDDEMRRKRKWKEIRQLWTMANLKEHKKGNIENALWHFGNTGVTVHHFVMAFIIEFNFENDLKYDNHLRWLYWSFEGGSDDKVDWRDILASFKLLTFFRMIQSRTIELLLMMFDIYAEGGNSPNCKPNDSWFIKIESGDLKKIFMLPCESSNDVTTMEEMYNNAIESLNDDRLVNTCVSDIINNHNKEKESKGRVTVFKKPKPDRITRSSFKQLCKVKTSIVSFWKGRIWDRLPTDSRLTALDDAQMDGFKSAEAIMYKWKVTEAIQLYNRNAYRYCFTEWCVVVLRESRVRKHYRKHMMILFGHLFRFWIVDTCKIKNRRKRKLLAEIMGIYALKARTFQRFKLFNFTQRRLMKIYGAFELNGKFYNLGGSHLRRYRYLVAIREAYHKWWNRCVEMINLDMVVAHNRIRLQTPYFLTWAKWALWEARQTRMELMVLENKERFDSKMLESELLVHEMNKIEIAKREIEAKEEEGRLLKEKQVRLEAARTRAQAEKKADIKLTLAIQRDGRRAKIKKVMKKMKKDFQKYWVTKLEENLQKARDRTAGYLADKDNEMAIQIKFERLREQFFEPPSRDNVQREKRITSIKNIVFLYLEAKLEENDLTIKEVMAKFDTDKKRYLTPKEMEKLIKSVGLKLNPVQVITCIQEVDDTGDGAIDLKELENAMAEVAKMGVPGSPWKLYVDPVQDVICYHNFKTGERIFEYEMTDERMKEIYISNVYGEAERESLIYSKEEKELDWDNRMKNYMAKRMQYMYRQWKCRKRRAKKLWAVNNAIMDRKRKKQTNVIAFIENGFLCAKVRLEFKKQLHLVYEKVWDTESGRMYWYNHHTKVSVWERPHLLWRYGDVFVPTPWVPVDVFVESKKKWEVHYWHVPGKTELPRKPDGLPLCQHCCKNIALHVCNTCELHYCFACTYKTHASPLGFFQKRKVQALESLDVDFMLKLKNSHHSFRHIVIPHCEMCKTENIYAGMHCEECAMDICRPCSRRLHSHKGTSHHKMTLI